MIQMGGKRAHFLFFFFFLSIFQSLLFRTPQAVFFVLTCFLFAPPPSRLGVRGGNTKLGRYFIFIFFIFIIIFVYNKNYLRSLRPFRQLEPGRVRRKEGKAKANISLKKSSYLAKGSINYFLLN